MSFGEGETIEILEETNADWWKGRNSHGETGLFPANYVERIAAPAVSAPSRLVAPMPSEKPQHQVYGYAPPPPQSYAVQAPPPPAEIPAPQGPPKKPSKFGKLGSTVRLFHVDLSETIYLIPPI